MDLAPSSDDDMGYVSETSANDDVGAERGLSVASSSDSDCPIQAVEGQQEHSDGCDTASSCAFTWSVASRTFAG